MLHSPAVEGLELRRAEERGWHASKARLRRVGFSSRIFSAVAIDALAALPWLSDGTVTPGAAHDCSSERHGAGDPSARRHGAI